MAISPDARGHGLATRFVKTGFQEYQRRGIKELKILAAEKIGPINKMYEKFGFQVTTKIENHGVVSNVYVVPTDYFEKTRSL
jgi:ribosomal protein S18 acetylase RimI-like enzyme